MAYRNEYASGDSLWRLVESDSVREFQGTIRYDASQGVVEGPHMLAAERGLERVTRIIVIDGSTVRHTVRNGYPQAEAALLQLAAVIIDLSQLRSIPRGSIPRPSTIRGIEDCQTFDAVLPGRNVVRRTVPGDSPRVYFRSVIHEILSGRRVDRDHETLIETMRAIAPNREFRCPAEDCPEQLQAMTGRDSCPCGKEEVIFETDSLRLHERFEDFGSSAQAYTAAQQVVEHLAMVNIMRFFEKRGLWSAFRSTAFVMDGPLAIFGMPAWLKSHVQSEVARLHQLAIEHGGPGVLLFGVEKSGMFLDHLKALDHSDADGPRARLNPMTALAPNREYTHRHIALRPVNAKAHGDVTDYGRRVMYKNGLAQHSVVMTPIVNSEGDDRDCVDLAAFPRLGEALDMGIIGLSNHRGLAQAREQMRNSCPHVLF
ncbi:MAG: hypothetical protein F4Z38_00775 [Chloroflexi bacterium]|nr:hypothetical protein [Chloroflexota bacterium]